MGTSTKSEVMSFASITRKVESVDDMREFIEAHEGMLDRNPDLTKQSFETSDVNEYTSSITDY